MISKVNKCDFCGSYYKNSHQCNIRRRDYYFHHINSCSNQWWETISFFPIGSCSSIKRLFITYDVETYTWHGKFGKQLVPFLLVFKLSGEPDLVNKAAEVACREQWNAWTKSRNTYFYLNPQKTVVGRQFKRFRQILQEELTNNLKTHFLSQNPHLQNFCEQHNISSSDDLTFQQLQTVKICGSPKFIEVIVVGHNINGFDEIVLAAQVINNKADIAPMFKIMRNFMPRNGKILFNDVTFALPNPSYKKRTVDFSSWENGLVEEEDMKYQYVKFMVRDTFALTHTSLRNAAHAYDLPVSKGSCPYKAVNAFYMLGSYQVDECGFPASQYWQSEAEYRENRDIWLKKNENAYDIVKHTLEYCAQDVKVTSLLVHKMMQTYKDFVQNTAGLKDCNFNVFQRPTISSNSQAIFKQLLFQKHQPNKASLGDIIMAPSGEMYEYVRSSIRGGRCYPTVIGVVNEPICVYDICGMYASALTHPLPSGRPLNPFDRALAIRKWEIKLSKSSSIDYFDTTLLPAIFTIDADAPDENDVDILPPFCSRKGGRLCWTNEDLRGEVATSIDVITLHNRGWKVRILPDEKTTVFPTWKCLAKDYVQLNIAAKEQADREKNQTLRSIAKLLSNALYGSFATKLDNKTTIFSDQLEEKFGKQIASGEYIVKSSSYIETEHFSAEVMPKFVVAYSPESRDPEFPTTDAELEENNDGSSIYRFPSHMTYTYKPITFLDSEETDMCLQTLEKVSSLVENNRYPSQIASFVLAWTRAFMSEWSDFLYKEDKGIPLKDRKLKTVYGDTDSLFTTKLGHQIMEEKGKKRLKKYGAKLVFDENKPELTWAVECETICKQCKEVAFSSESIFLAPKLYALKNTVCSSCNAIGPGKLRAKGHATEQLQYETLVDCYYNDVQGGSNKFHSERLSLKRTLVSHQAHVQPFTVTETTLTRTLRPWKDRTLVNIDHQRLIPYSNANPNPRNKEVCLIQLPWDM